MTVNPHRNDDIFVAVGGALVVALICIATMIGG